MDKRKRKAGALGLERRVRARAEPEPDLDEVDESPSEFGGFGDEGQQDVEEGFVPTDSDDASVSLRCLHAANTLLTITQDGDESSDEETEGIDASQVSFGALAKAQAALSSSRRRKGGEPDDRPQPDNAFDSGMPFQKGSKAPTHVQRSSKHAPMEMTSKRQVSRRREILPVKKIEYRDPRFDSLGSGPLDEARAERAYAFLDDYRNDEMKQLKAAVKKAKTPREKEELQRALMSMESKKKAKDRKERERAVVEEHRKQEKELVKQGKRPFYLKKSEQKKRLLLDQFASMSEKQVEKAIEKKRKKVAAKEKKEMPFARRGAEES